MRHAPLILILSAGLIAVALALRPFERPATSPGPHHDYSQPLPGRAGLVAAPDLIATPGRFHGKRVVLEGLWGRGFEESSLDVAEGQSFRIWVDLWDSKEFATEAAEFFQRIVAEDKDPWSMPAVRLRAEGSFYYLANPGLSGFGHLGGSEALFLVDRILSLERLPPKKPTQ